MNAAGVAVSLALATSALARTTPTEKCEAGKYKAATAYATCRANAERRMFLSGDTDKYTRVLSLCADKLVASFQRLDESALRKGVRCPAGGDPISVKHLVDAYLQDVAWRVALLPLRFADNGDGTITDHHTGLMWEKKVGLSDAGDYSNLHHANNGYFWSGLCQGVGDLELCQPSAEASAACSAGVEGSAAGCGQCLGGAQCFTGFGGETTIWQWLVDLNDANFAGHGDWRIPTATELFTIVDQQHFNPAVPAYPFQGASCGPTCLDLTNPACSCTNPTLHFTATTNFLVPVNAWMVNFIGGELATINKASDVWVRAVRGP